MKTIHLLTNAHLDPVWYWDWQEGLNESLRTCRTMVKLLDEFPDLTFNRGEAYFYDHLEHADPKLFQRIRELIEEGRWCVVGGNWIQPDHNMPCSEAILRQYQIGQEYFKNTFGFNINVAWSADCFGHSAGIPDVLAACGFKYFSCNRPMPHTLQLPAETFYWKGQGTGKVLASRLDVGWYGCESDAAPARLDALLQRYADRPHKNIPSGMGVGDHGGGTTRQQLDDIRKWKEQHPEVNVVFSTFDRYFAAIEQEIAENNIQPPTYSGEMNFCLTGCYASLPAFKKAYRQAESTVRIADRIENAVNAYLNIPFKDSTEQWKDICFNDFHDILPCSSTERAMNYQKDQLNGTTHTARKRIFAALQSLSTKINITVPKPEGYAPEQVPIVLFNPNPRTFKGTVEVECALDYRPLRLTTTDCLQIFDENDKPMPFQEIDTEMHNSPIGSNMWRKRAVLNVEMPAFGWKVVKVGADPQPVRCQPPTEDIAKPIDNCSIGNGILTIVAKPGEQNITIKRQDLPDFNFSLANYLDPYGSWGDMADTAKGMQLQDLQEVFEITRTIITEKGPQRAAMFVELAGRKSSISLLFRLNRKDHHFSVQARLMWDDRARRLKLRFPQGHTIAYDCPAAETQRQNTGQVPGIRYAKIYNEEASQAFAFASNCGYSYDNLNGFFTWTLARGCHYSSVSNSNSQTDPHRPVERGEVVFDFLWGDKPELANELADQLEFPVQTFVAWPNEGALPPAGQCSKLDLPKCVELVSANNGANGDLVVQNRSKETIELKTINRAVTLPPWNLVTISQKEWFGK